MSVELPWSPRSSRFSATTSTPSSAIRSRIRRRWASADGIDPQIEHVIGQEIPQELLSLVMSLSAIPTIRCSPNGAASMIASTLSSLIRDQIVAISCIPLIGRNPGSACSRTSRGTRARVSATHCWFFWTATSTWWRRWSTHHTIR